MGMARAVGMKRRHLIQGFIAEGAAYDLGAALIGAALGVLVAFAIAGLMGRLIGQYFSITPHTSWRSLVVAYSLGVAVTFITILFASLRSSRLNIVQAIRDLPEFKISQRLRPRLKSWWPWSVINFGRRIYGYYVGWWSTLLIVLSIFVLLPVGADKNNAFLYTLGISLLGLGLALLLRRWLPNRLVYTLVSALELVFWLSPSGWFDWLFPDLDGGFEMFFLSGIMMVTFATLLIMWNAEAITWFMGQIGRVVTRWIPAIKTAVAYPLASKGRTGLTIAMFSMVIFSLVTISTINSNFSKLFSSENATAGWDIGVLANNTNPVGDLKSELQAVNSSVDTSNFGDTGRLSSISMFNAQVRNAGDTEWKRYLLNGMDAGYLQHAAKDIPLEARATGYASDADVWNAVASNPNLIVVDANASTGGDFGASQQFKLEGTDGKKPFNPIPIELHNASSGAQEQVTVIGVIDQKVSTAFGLFLNNDELTKVYPNPDYQTIFVQLNSTTDKQSKDVAKQIKADLISKGVDATSLRATIKEQLSISNGFFTLLQGFMGLGLFVGVAALGVISFRAVVERRQQIGMLRALGYQRNMVATSFLLESLVIAILGVGSGTIMGLILSYNLINSDQVNDSGFSGFTAPWGVIAFFVIASLLAAAVMTWIPARKASSVPIAEALRYE
jgi:putative ABC transport system permease protein